MIDKTLFSNKKFRYDSAILRDETTYQVAQLDTNILS